MRHDEHYVEALAASASSPIGRLLPIDQIDPNPNQPRQVMGDLSELVASIAEKGILEPILVRRRQGRFQIIAGERRYQAAVQAGLPEVPAIVKDIEDDEVTEIALIENLQRKDLTPFEEAEALAQLSERGGLTHDQIAKRLGKSRTAVTETLSLNQMPEDVRNLCRLADIHSKSLLQIGRRSHRDRPHREPPAQGPDRVRGSRSAGAAQRTRRTDPRPDRQAPGEVAYGRDGDAFAESDAGRRPKSLSAGRHSL